MKRSLVVTSVVIVIFAMAAGHAEAVKPIKFSGSGSGQVPIGYCAEGGFEVWEDASWELTGKAFFDKDGNLVRIHRKWRVEGEIYNYDFPELALEYKNSVYNEVVDVESGETRFVGLWALITIPGYGAVFIDAGLVIVDENFNVIFQAGQHQWWDGNVDGVCEHLAP